VTDTNVVHDLTVTESVEIGLNLTPLRMKLLSFMVGNNGPFVKRIAAVDFTEEWAKQQIATEVATLRAIGAIPQT